MQMAHFGNPFHKVPPGKSIIVRPNTGHPSDPHICQGSDRESKPSSKGELRRKKVSFADDQGLSLSTFKLVEEFIIQSPTLGSKIANGASHDEIDKHPIKITFAQPASDYMAFRDKLNRNMVCLENIFLRNYTAEGTIKVKNISSEKRVFVRLSQDEWLSFEDTVAKYVPGPGTTSDYHDPYDLFAFSLEVSPSFDKSKQIQFAVCFESNGRQYWDNCSGFNYVIVSENYVERETGNHNFDMRFLPSKRRQESWAEFCAWTDDNDSPYY